jgi:hypothetical protein
LPTTPFTLLTVCDIDVKNIRQCKKKLHDYVCLHVRKWKRKEDREMVLTAICTADVALSCLGTWIQGFKILDKKIR